MNSSTSVDRYTATALRGVIALGLLIGILMAVLFTFHHPHAAREAFQVLATGWITLPLSTIRRVSFDWNALGLALICSVVALLALHAVGRWLGRGIQPGWSWRLTLATFFMVGWLFILSVVVAGVDRCVRSLTVDEATKLQPLALNGSVEDAGFALANSTSPELSTRVPRFSDLAQR
jgi:hypothetical protein